MANVIGRQYTYNRSKCATFRITKDPMGGLSNMCAGFPLLINGVDILTSEALFQAIQFPLHPKCKRRSSTSEAL